MSDGLGPEAAEPEPGAPVRYAEPLASWLIMGFWTSTAAPCSLVVVYDVPWLTAAAALPTAIVGIMGGFLLALLDPPGWMRGMPLDQDIGIFRVLGVLVVCTLLGAVWWSGIGAATPALLVFGAGLVGGPSPPPDAWQFILVPAVVGACIGSPIVLFFGLGRVVGHLSGRPFLASVVASAQLTLVVAAFAVVTLRLFGPIPTRW
jgi:hypothetical protein